MFHQGVAARYLGKDVRATWQIGEASVIAERLRCPVVSDFRPADLAAGGQGAPLVPMLDYVMFRSEKVSRVLQNLGGIANLTSIPADAGVEELMAFDTGPANMVIDACMEQLFGKAFDRGGATARRGRVLQSVVDATLLEPYFSALPPKSCGREEFGAAFASRFIAQCRQAGANDADVVATATALTAASIVDAYGRFVQAHVGHAMPVEFVVAGGGAKNATLMRMLREGLVPLGVQVRLMEELGVAAEAKEGGGVCSAGLADLAWVAGECSGGDWGKADGGAGQGDEGMKLESLLARTGKSKMRGFLPCDRLRVEMTVFFILLMGTTGCKVRVDDSHTVVVEIESSPNNLDLRQGTDAQSERVGGLIFDALVKKDAHFNLKPWLATSWEQPDALTWVFHLRDGVRFQDGRPLEAADVVWTIRSMIDGTLVTAKGGAFAPIERMETPDRLTVVVHLKQPYAGLLFNMSDGLFGVVPRGSGRDFGLHPVGSGPFQFVSQVQDKEVIVKRNPSYWAGPAKIERIQFAVIPDTVTGALELQKGSADIASNVVTPDMVHVLAEDPRLQVESGESSVVIYANFNVNDPVLKDRPVRQAIAYALDRQAIVDAIWRGQARLANTLLPAEHWAAANGDPSTGAGMAAYPHDVARAKMLLDAAGFHPGKDGVRLRFTLKISTDETTRLMAQVMQQQLRAAGIDLEIRSRGVRDVLLGHNTRRIPDVCASLDREQ